MGAYGAWGEWRYHIRTSEAAEGLGEGMGSPGVGVEEGASLWLQSTGEEALPEAAERAEVMVTTVLWWSGQEQGKTLVPWPSQVRRRFIL